MIQDQVLASDLQSCSAVVLMFQGGRESARRRSLLFMTLRQKLLQCYTIPPGALLLQESRKNLTCCIEHYPHNNASDRRLSTADEKGFSPLFAILTSAHMSMITSSFAGKPDIMTVLWPSSIGPGGQGPGQEGGWLV